MTILRSGGILLHITSLPSKYGIGDLGKEAYEFVDFLSRSKQKLWQVLPLNPVGYGESPFQSYSSFAGNPLLISIDLLLEERLLSNQDVANVPSFNPDLIEFEQVRLYKKGLFNKAFVNFQRKLPEDYKDFCIENKWLADHALFMALKKHFNNKPWNCWEKPIALRKTKSVEFYQDLLKKEIEYHYFLQYIFSKQWQQLKKYANSFDIKIIGDLPIFVSHDSSDAWANPKLFKLDAAGNPAKVSGVPPDYFSATGQVWGNPHYRWSEMAKDDYQWWRDRFAQLLKMVDIIRIDHFRGFEAYWEIPAGEEFAVNGKWVKGPGKGFFTTIIRYLGEIPVIAEDLGIITPAVTELKERFNFPGMNILHFNLHCNEKEEFLPDQYEENSVVYTGTHDNDTTLGWYNKLSPDDLEFLQEYLNWDPRAESICWRLIDFAFQCKSNYAIIPLQDILCLDSEARMNYPGTIGGTNWAWRCRPGSLTQEIENRLRSITEDSGRVQTVAVSY